MQDSSVNGPINNCGSFDFLEFFDPTSFEVFESSSITQSITESSSITSSTNDFFSPFGSFDTSVNGAINGAINGVSNSQFGSFSNQVTGHSNALAHVGSFNSYSTAASSNQLMQNNSVILGEVVQHLATACEHREEANISWAKFQSSVDKTIINIVRSVHGLVNISQSAYAQPFEYNQKQSIESPATCTKETDNWGNWISADDFANMPIFLDSDPVSSPVSCPAPDQGYYQSNSPVNGMDVNGVDVNEMDDIEFLDSIEMTMDAIHSVESQSPPGSPEGSHENPPESSPQVMEEVIFAENDDTPMFEFVIGTDGTINGKSFIPTHQSTSTSNKTYKTIVDDLMLVDEAPKRSGAPSSSGPSSRVKSSNGQISRVKSSSGQSSLPSSNISKVFKPVSSFGTESVTINNLAVTHVKAYNMVKNSKCLLMPAKFVFVKMVDLNFDPNERIVAPNVLNMRPIFTNIYYKITNSPDPEYEDDDASLILLYSEECDLKFTTTVCDLFPENVIHTIERCVPGEAKKTFYLINSQCEPYLKFEGNVTPSKYYLKRCTLKDDRPRISSQNYKLSIFHFYAVGDYSDDRQLTKEDLCKEPFLMKHSRFSSLMLRSIGQNTVDFFRLVSFDAKRGDYGRFSSDLIRANKHLHYERLKRQCSYKFVIRTDLAKINDNGNPIKKRRRIVKAHE